MADESPIPSDLGMAEACTKVLLIRENLNLQKLIAAGDWGNYSLMKNLGSIGLSFLSQDDLLGWLKQYTETPERIYDKAMDEIYFSKIIFFVFLNSCVSKI